MLVSQYPSENVQLIQKSFTILSREVKASKINYVLLNFLKVSKKINANSEGEASKE